MPKFDAENTNTNSVVLNGTVSGCRIDGDHASVYVGVMYIDTDMPGDSNLANRTKFRTHLVRVGLSDENRGFFENLARQSVYGPIRKMVPCEVNGRLRSDSDGNSYVECPSGGFKEAATVRYNKNNVFTLDGRLVSRSSTPSVASFSIEVDGGTFNGIVPKAVCPRAYAALTGNKITVDTNVRMSGSADSLNLSDNTRAILLMPRNIKALTLAKKTDVAQTSGPTM